MKRTELEKLEGKKVGAAPGPRGDPGTALGRREQALARKRELLEKARRRKGSGA